MLKIDIENTEWYALPQMLASGTLRRKVKQLVIELHLFNERRLHMYSVMRWLERQGFLITNLHRNSLWEWGFEVSFANSNLVPLKVNSCNKSFSSVHI